MMEPASPRGSDPRRNRLTPDAAELGLPSVVRCPFCEGLETELHAPFGTALSVATYWCRRCRSAFEWVKPG
ncbi:MAG: hypothetical protein ACRELD_14735 [Longimicrobiales bacterium]